VDSIRQGWQTFQGKRKKLFRGMIYFWGSLILIWAFKLQNPLVSKVITTAYNAPKTNWLGQIFRIYAPNANTVPLADYIQRAQEISSTALGLLIFLLPLLGFGALVLYALQPHKSLWQDIVLFHIRQFQAKNRGYWIPVLIAGSIWGLAVSIRVTNLTAFGIVVGYLFVKLGKRSILPLITYTLAAALVCFITWPYLWYFGWQGFIDSLTVFSNFPREGGLVWLRGVIQIKDIPPNYLLHTMAIQFTEPLIFLAVMGIIVSIILAFRKKFPVLDLILLLCWFFLPILYAAIAHPTLYNNFRQFIFITPPLFFFSGVLMGWTGRHIKSKIILGLLLVMILSPGMIGIMQLHPYQYVYYNQFVGGTEGAAGLYEMDYWFTAYKEVVQYLNENAPANSKVMVYGNYKIADHYARPDLQLSSVPFDTTPEELAKFDYVMMTTNRRGELESLNMDLYKTIYEAKAGNTTMAFIKNTTP
jgi:hypothetical protein